MCGPSTRVIVTGTITDLGGREVTYVSRHQEKCSCGKSITCFQTADGSIVEHRHANGFHLWGPDGVCTECDARMSKEVSELA